MIGITVHRNTSASVPQIYTAEELSVAVHDLMLHLVTANDEEVATYAQVMSAVASGRIVALGIRDGKFAFGLPEAAGWLNKETQ